MDAVLLEAVTKQFDGKTAVDEVSLQVPPGTIYGFIGPNGSGKTTILRMIMRILRPDRGRIVVLGESAHDAADDRVGYLPEERGLYKRMKVRDVLSFFAELKGMHPNRPAVDAWLERMGLQDWAGKRVDALSKGMAQKVQFIAAVVARPQLVLLDEPFSGLDPVNAEGMLRAVLDLKREGSTVILSAHDMEIAEKMCDRIFMIFRGRKVLDGTLEEIQDAYGSDTVRLRLDGPLPAQLPGLIQVTDFGRWQELQLQPGTDPQEVLARLMSHGKVRHFELARPSLRDIFVRIVGPELNGPTEN